MITEGDKMRLGDLKEIMFLPKKEISINRTVEIRGVDVHLLSVTSEEHRNVLWAMYQLPYDMMNSEIDEVGCKYASNREELAANIRDRMKPHHIHIDELTIQNQKMNFSGSTAGPIQRNDYEGYMKLQHFVEKEMIAADWDSVNLNNLVIAKYEQADGGEFPTINQSADLEITIKLSPDFKQMLVNQQMTLELGEMEKGIKLYFYEPGENKERTYYINRIYSYDIWKEIDEKFEAERLKILPKEEVMEMKKSYCAHLEKICPRGMNLAMLEYETENGEQLEFYTKEYLDKEPTPKTSTESTIMLFKPDRKFGDNGFKCGVCMLKPIEKDFKGKIDVELFSFIMTLPEEVITV